MNPITKEEAANLQSETAQEHGGNVPKGSLAAEKQSEADRTAHRIAVINEAVRQSAHDIARDRALSVRSVTTYRSHIFR